MKLFKFFFLCISILIATAATYFIFFDGPINYNNLGRLEAMIFMGYVIYIIGLLAYIPDVFAFFIRKKK